MSFLNALRHSEQHNILLHWETANSAIFLMHHESEQRQQQQQKQKTVPFLNALRHSEQYNILLRWETANSATLYALGEGIANLYDK